MVPSPRVSVQGSLTTLWRQRYIYVYIYPYIYVCIYPYICVCVYPYICVCAYPYIYMVICCGVLVTLSGDSFSSLQRSHQGIYLGKSLCCFGIFNPRPVPRWSGRAGSIPAPLPSSAARQLLSGRQEHREPYFYCLKA